MIILNKIKINIGKILISFIFVFILLPQTPAFATVMQSSTYKIDSDSINFAGNRSTSSSYKVEDTVGEVGTGELSLTNYKNRGGYQQASVSSTASGGSDSSSGNTSSTLSSGSGYGVVNVLEFTATPLDKSIYLKWIYPNPSSTQSVRIVRSELFFPSSISDGEVVFEGNGNSAIDNDVEAGTTYYYSIFTMNALGDYSSGVLAQATIPVPGVNPIEVSNDPFINIPSVVNVDPIIKALTLSDFDFIQSNKSIVHAGDTVAIDGNTSLTVRLDYNKVPEILKTIAVSLVDPEDSTKVFNFLLRVNKDKTAYEATIGALKKGGNYKMHIIILDYRNQGLKRLNGDLRSVVFESIKILSGLKNINSIIVLLSILCIVLLIVSVMIIKRKRTLGLLLFILMFTFGAGLYFSIAKAAINKQINYQGKLFTSSGTAVSDASYNIRYKLYTASSGGSPIWTETLCYSPDSGTTCDGTGTDSRASVTSGLFSNMLGSITALDSVSFNQTLYLGVEVGGSAATPSWDGEMTPRKKIGTVPAAFEADRLDGLSSEQFLRTDASNSTTTSSTFLTFIQNGAGNIVDFIGQSSQTVMSILSSGNVGIGTTSPYAKLSVVGQAVAEYFTATSTTIASVFPYASTTALSATTLCLTGDSCRTTWPTGGSGGLGWASSTSPDSNSIYSLALSNVGIGTSSPYAKLSVVGEVVAANFTATSTTATSTFVGGLSVGGGLVTSNGLNVYNNGSTFRVAIGTSTASSIFDVFTTGNPQFFTNRAFGTGGALTLKLIALSSTDNVTAGFANTLSFSMEDSSGATFTNSGLISNIWEDAVSPTRTAGFAFSTLTSGSGAATEKMRLTGAGNLGIGTTTPNNLLDIFSATKAAIGFSGASGDTYKWTIGMDKSNGGRFAISSSTALGTVDRLVIDGGGNVGIGTSSPYAKLSVVGQIVGQYFTATSSTASTFPYASTTALTVSSAAFFPGSGVWNASGFVGIGTTSPYAALSVVGSTGVVADIFTATSTSVSTFAGPINTSGTTGGYRINNTLILQASSTNFSTLVGQSAGAALLADGLSNTAIGYEALKTATSSDSNTAVGYQALRSNMAGFNNTANGYQSLYSNTSGSYNIANGHSSLYSNTTGINNVASGYRSLYANTTGSSNTANGHAALSGNTTGTGNVANGWASLPVSSTGSYNTASGYQSLFSNTTGNSNSAYGAYSLYANTTGINNVASGYYSSAFNTTGSNNTASGYQSLAYNTSATSSTAIGYQAANGAVLNYNNQGGTYVGYQSGYSAATGSDYNTLVGYKSGYGVTTGARNVFLGNSTIAASYNQVTTGSNNISIGNDVAVASSTLSNQLSIGNLIYGTGLSGTGATVSSGNIGIGTSSPYSRLAVFGGGTGTGGIFELTNSASTTLMKVLDNGNVGIATTSPWRTLSVVGTVAMNGLTSSATGNAVCITASKEITDAGGASCTPSSIRFKENVLAMTPGYALGQISKLNIVDFDYKEKQPFETNHSYGMIAEEVEKVDKNLVDYGYDGKPLSLHFEKITGLLVQAVQEQQGQIVNIGSTTSKLDLSNNELAKTSSLAITNANSRIEILESQFANLYSSSTLISSLASSTANILASSTADTLARSQSFFEKILSSFTDYLMTAVINVKGIFVKELHVEDKLCVDDVCINKDQLKALIIQSTATSTNTANTITPITPVQNTQNTVTVPVTVIPESASTSTSASTTPVIEAVKVESTTTPVVSEPIKTPTTPIVEPTSSPDPVPTPEKTEAATPVVESTPVKETEPAPAVVPAPVVESAPVATESSTQP